MTMRWFSAEASSLMRVVTPVLKNPGAIGLIESTAPLSTSKAPSSWASGDDGTRMAGEAVGLPSSSKPAVVRNKPPVLFSKTRAASHCMNACPRLVRSSQFRTSCTTSGVSDVVL